MHWLSDVIGGWLFGILWLAVVVGSWAAFGETTRAASEPEPEA